MPYFEETQRFWGWLRAALLSGVLVFAAVIIVLQYGQTTPLQTVRSLWVVWGIMAVIDGALVFSGMVTQVLPEGIVVRCSPFGFLKRRIDWNDIQRLYARTYAPLAEYGGWGIRLGKSGTAYNIRGSQGIQVELKNGKKVLIGTQHPDAFMAAVRTAAPMLCD